MDFDCGYEASEGGGVVCRVTGEIDLANAQDLKYRAIEAMKSHGPPLVIDFSGVTFMDVSGGQGAPGHPPPCGRDRSLGSDRAAGRRPVRVPRADPY